MPTEASQKLHLNRLLQLAREAGQTAVYQFKEYEQARRHGTLVALMIETAATLTDEIVDLNDRLIGSFFTKSKNKYERTFAEQGKAINDKVRLYAKVGAALIDARELGRDPFTAIEAVVPWESFSASVKEAAELARGEDFDALSLIGEHYSQLRRYPPELIETLQFRPAPVALVGTSIRSHFPLPILEPFGFQPSGRRAPDLVFPYVNTLHVAATSAIRAKSGERSNKRAPGVNRKPPFDCWRSGL